MILKFNIPYFMHYKGKIRSLSSFDSYKYRNLKYLYNKFGDHKIPDFNLSLLTLF